MDAIWQGEIDPNEASINVYGRIESGELILNQALIGDIINERAQALSQIRTASKSVLEPAYGVFDLSEFSSQDKSPFQIKEGRPEITTKGRERVYEYGREIAWLVRERLTGKRVMFKELPFEMSRHYSMMFGNAFQLPDKEYWALGGFVEGQSYPFMWAAFTRLKREDQAKMLELYRFDASNMLEVRRAWSSIWTPKNTMSLFYTFAISQLRKMWFQEHGKALQALITSVNPNFGKSNPENPKQENPGLTFRSCNFVPIALKPEQFTYYINDEGDPELASPAKIAERLGITIEEVKRHPRFRANQSPLTDTHELICPISTDEREELLNKPVFIYPTKN